MHPQPLPEYPAIAPAPAYPALAAQQPSPQLSHESRVLLGAMQLKDTVQILLMLSDGTLIFGVIFGIGVPGLVLYLLRWGQLRFKVGRNRSGAVLLSLLSLLHEAFWAWAFQSDKGQDPITHHNSLLAALYWLGAALMAGQLLMALCGFYRTTDDEPVAEAE